MKREPIYVAFATQKGGVGKSAFTVLVASYLQYVKGFNVAIVDCDYPQYSINALRTREKEKITKDEFYKGVTSNFYSSHRSLCYPVMCSKAEDATTKIEQELLTDGNQYDIILLDLPGTVNTTGVITTLTKVDYIFTPITADRFVLESSLSFASHLNETIVMNQSGRLKGIYLFWNLVDAREKTALYDSYENGICSLGIEVLKTAIPDTKRFRKEMSVERRMPFRSTLLPPDKKAIKGSGIVELIDEICDIINLVSSDEA